VLSSVREVFGSTSNSKEGSQKGVQARRSKIGPLTMENDFLERVARADPPAGMGAMVNKCGSLSLTRQFALLALPRSAHYPRSELRSFECLSMISLVDRYYLKNSFFG